MENHSSRWLISVVAWSLPALVMLTAFGAIVAHTGSVWPWFEVVHESGNRTLMGTVFYYEHAMRELPLDLVLGLTVGGCAVWAFPGSLSTSRSRQLLLAASTLLVIGVIVASTLWTGGPAMLWENLMQMPTRPGEALSFGSHWRYHFLSRLMLMLVSFGMAGLIVFGLRGRRGRGSNRGQKIFLLALGLFLIISVVFVLDSNSFLNPMYLGHQVREVLTHTLVTIPLSWWVCVRLSAGSGSGFENGMASVVWPLIAGTGGALVGLYLLVAALATSSVSMGQTDSLVLLIWPHFFEHSFSYLLVPLVAGLIYETAQVSDMIAVATGAEV